MAIKSAEQTFGDDSEKIASIISAKTGLEAKPVGDDLWYHDSDENGRILILVRSDEALEDDLSQFEHGETLLPRERQTQIIHEGYAATLNLIGKYVPQAKIQALFPKLDLEDLNSYDFTLSKIRLFIFSEADFDYLYRNMFPLYNKSPAEYKEYEDDIKSTGGITVLNVDEGPSSLVKNEMHVDISERKVIVLRETNIRLREYIEEQGKLPRELTQYEQEIVAKHVKGKVAHELIHNLDVARGLPMELMEGVTEWYAQQVLGENVLENAITNRKDVMTGYGKATATVAILIEALLESNVGMNTINSALISNDIQARENVAKALAKRYGAGQAEVIFEWRFIDAEMALRYVADLECRHDSKVGAFLRNAGTQSES